MGCGAGGIGHGMALLALFQNLKNLSPSLLWVGGFLPKTTQLIKYSPPCNLQTERFIQNPMHTFSHCMPKIMCAIFCRRGLLTECCANFGKWAGFSPPTNRMATFLDHQCDRATLIYQRNQKNFDSASST